MADNPLDGIDIKQDVINRPITHEDIYYLLQRYAHLHICDPAQATIDYATPAKEVQMANGWTLLDHGNLIRVAAPQLSMDGYNGMISDEIGEVLPAKKQGAEDDTAGGGSAGGFISGHGTLVWQMVIAAQGMANIALERWQGIHILSGFYGMKRALWIALKSYGRSIGKEIVVGGFEPRDEDWVVYHYVQDISGGVQLAVSQDKIKSHAVESANRPSD